MFYFYEKSGGLQALELSLLKGGELGPSGLIEVYVSASYKNARHIVIMTFQYNG